MTQGDHKMQKMNSVRCAIYCRVSTEHEEQIRSADNQVEDITRLLQQDERCEIVKVYEDRGKTGTKADRDSFQEMMTDARAGLFQVIVTKSISRFARSVVIAVGYAEELERLPHPVGIYFIEERLYSLRPDAKFTLGILSMVAQQESQNISNHIMQTFDSKMKNGIKVNGSAPFGYECVTGKDGNRTLKIVKKEAKIVQQIYKWYLDGLSTVQISQELRKTYGIKKRATTVAKILHLETYIGDLKQKKSYTAGVRGKRKLSKDEDTYTIHNAHPAIISKEDFEEVQRLFKESGRGRHSRDRHPLSGLIHCGRCGRMYNRHSARDGLAWMCSSYQESYVADEVRCPGKKFKTTHEDTIMRLCEQAVYFLNYDLKNPKTQHFTKEQQEYIKQIQEDMSKQGVESVIRQ